MIDLNETEAHLAHILQHDGNDLSPNDQQALRDAIEIVSGYRERRQAVLKRLSSSYRPDTLEKCWECIEYMDVECAGAMDDERRWRAAAEQYQRADEANSRALGAMLAIVNRVAALPAKWRADLATFSSGDERMQTALVHPKSLVERAIGAFCEDLEAALRGKP